MQRLTIFISLLILALALPLAEPTTTLLPGSGLWARPPATGMLSAHRGRKSKFYRVQPGDTLTSIAGKFGLSVSQLRRWNRIKPGSILPMGRTLLIRAPAPAHKRVRSARRNRTRTSSGKKYTEEHSWYRRKSGTRVLLPPDYKLPSYRRRVMNKDGVQLRVAARTFTRGEAAYVEVSLPAGYKNSVELTQEGKAVPLSKRGGYYAGLIALSPYGKKSSETLTVNWQDKGKKVETSFSLSMRPARFATVVWKTFLGNYDKPRPKLTAEQKARSAKRRAEARKLIASSTRKKRKAFAVKSDDQLTESLAHPRGHHKVTSKFFTRRKIARFYIKNKKRHWKKAFYRRHHGLDLHGKTGAPIYAMADGTVVAAQMMYYEGNFTVIDHGNGVFSGYMHQSKMMVREGQKVKAGELIGEVGTTGRVTGPHLHAGLYIRGTAVHPLSLLALPIRN